MVLRRPDEPRANEGADYRVEIDDLCARYPSHYRCPERLLTDEGVLILCRCLCHRKLPARS